VRGNIELRRGFFEVFGKRFVLDRGSMSFDGGDEIDPQVIMVATHEMRLPANTLVTVTVTGTLTAPDVEFRSNHPECDDRSEIITMLISGRCDLGQTGSADDQSGAEQAANVLAGIAAGVLTLSLRRELGDVLPVIVVETGDAGRTGRVRAGFDASSAIPEFLRGVVRGAYFEGMLGGTAENEENQGGVNPGFLLELQFPYDLVLTGEVETVTGGNPAGRLDLTWEP
jgi:translocation and assembly module TamB